MGLTRSLSALKSRGRETSADGTGALFAWLIVGGGAINYVIQKRHRTNHYIFSC